MADVQPLSGTIDIEGTSYPFRGIFGAENDAGGARLAWSAEVDGLGLLPGSGVVAYPGGYQGANVRAVTFFVQDHFQGRVRLREFESRNGIAR